jgi:hypothetical protein
MLLPEPATIQEVVRESSWEEDGTNVFREPKVVNLLTSTPERCRLERTKTLLSCGEYHTQCYGSLRDPLGRAICERFLAIGSLKGRVRLSSNHYEVR